MTARTKKKIEAIVHLTRVSVEGLLGKAGTVLPNGMRSATVDALGDPSRIARELRELWQVPTGSIRNVTGMLESAGIVVVERSLDSRAQDAVSSWPRVSGRPPIMMMNSGLPGDRQRFTLAHELGHLVMHDVPADDQEAEANTFASELLAPAAEIATQLAGLTTRDFPRLLELKPSWGMSVAALIRRARDVEAITDRQYREFQVQLGRLGWRTLEPGTLAAERPTLLQSAVLKLRADHGYTTIDLAKAARMTADAFQRHFGTLYSANDGGAA